MYQFLIFAPLLTFRENNITFCLKMITHDPSIFTKDHLNLIVCILMGEISFVIKALNWWEYCYINDILIYFSLTVKAATLIFIYGRGLAISSAEEGKSGFIYNLVKSLYALEAAHTCVHFMKVLTIYTLTLHVWTLKAHIRKSHMFLLSAEMFWRLFNKQCRSRSACFYRSSLIWVHTVCVFTYVKQWAPGFECS